MLDRLDVEAMKADLPAGKPFVSYDEGAVRALAGAVEGTPERRLQDRLVLEGRSGASARPLSLVVNKVRPAARRGPPRLLPSRALLVAKPGDIERLSLRLSRR